MLKDIKDKVVLITGAAGYLGKECAYFLAGLGANLVLVDINNSQEISSEIEKKYKVKAHPIIVDFMDEKQVISIANEVKQRYGKLNGIVASAAFVGTSELEGWAVPFKEQSAATWRKALEVNLTANFVLFQSCLELLEKNNASIINIGSIYGMCAPDMSLYKGTDMGNPAAYAVSKGGLIQFTRWLASMLAPDIRVNCLSLGGIERGQPKEFVRKYIEKTPLKRMAKESDIVGMIALLLSEDSSYITGQNIVLDGGWSIW